MSIILKLLSNIIETRINKSYSLLELTSKLPEVTNVWYANMITEKFMEYLRTLIYKKGILQGIFLKRMKILLLFSSLYQKEIHT
ncbi:MAG TPA: hypothetical protein VFY41_05425 [Nitrososphaeraceae archaeon]|nr:hypothetical protein [Nitrososphaeraceae archaeon]